MTFDKDPDVRRTADDEDAGDPPPDAAVAIPIDGTLDLHTFSPRDVGELVPDYVAECRARGILQVRIVHGKGTGALRRSVHAILGRLPEVESFGLADERGGAWGATLVTLKAP
jgi:DNA-nicking Smr family endonuclease